MSISPGSEKGLDIESTFEVVRLLFNCDGENKIVLFDPRISFDDQNIQLMERKISLDKSDLKIQG